MLKTATAQCGECDRAQLQSLLPGSGRQQQLLPHEQFYGQAHRSAPKLSTSLYTGAYWLHYIQAYTNTAHWKPTLRTDILGIPAMRTDILGVPARLQQFLLRQHCITVVIACNTVLNSLHPSQTPYSAEAVSHEKFVVGMYCWRVYWFLIVV